jgi:hypothetical protein
VISVERRRELITGILILDEIGEAIGAGNRADDACGDNAQSAGSNRPAKAPRRAATLRREAGPQAIARLFFWL